MGDCSDVIASWSYEILEKVRGVSIIHQFLNPHFVIQLDFALTAHPLFSFSFSFSFFLFDKCLMG